MWGVLLVPSSSPTLSLIYDGLDVNVTCNVTWFHLNHDMVSHRIYTLSFYGGHSITLYLSFRIRTSDGRKSIGKKKQRKEEKKKERKEKKRKRKRKENRSLALCAPLRCGIHRQRVAPQLLGPQVQG